MASIRGEVEGRRERLMALVLMLQAASRARPLTQDEIVKNLRVDEYPSQGKIPRKVLAYQGSETAVRQKFERDKADIRELGFAIETVPLDDGGTGYFVDPEAAYAPPIHFSEDELRIVGVALRLFGFGAAGALGLFVGGGAVGDGGLEFTNFYTPMMRALQTHRVLSFGYHSSTNKVRRVEPLLIEVYRGTPYLIARVAGTDEVKGYRVNRITSLPVVEDETFVVNEELMVQARGWRPEYAKAPRPVDVVIETSENFAELLARQFPLAERARKKDGRVEVGLSFEGPWAALRFLLEAADRVTLRAPKSLKEALRDWLKSVNRGARPDPTGLRFPGPSSPDVLGQTLQLLHAVYQSDEGLRVSDLSERFSLAPEHVRLIMDRLVSLQPFGNRAGYLTHVLKECDDWDDPDDDSLYRADYSDTPAAPEPPSLLLRDLVELNIALREAARAVSDPALSSAVEKIEAAVSRFVHVDSVPNEPFLGVVRDAVERREQLKVEYTSAHDSHAQVRWIEPREVRVLNGHALVRAWCATREEWRTFRIDRIGQVLARSRVTEERPADPQVNWLTQVGEEGDEVVVAVEPHRRWLFEPLPGSRWCEMGDGRMAVRFRLSDPTFLDHLMLQAGDGAVVLTERYATAGQALARRIAERL